MRILADKDVRFLLTGILICLAGFLTLSWFIAWRAPNHLFFCLLPIAVLTGGGILACCARYFFRQSNLIETAMHQINACLAGNAAARIDCDEEGELYKLFHAVNTMAAVLNAHMQTEMQSREFLKNTISDISHQLKTPLAALHIYNDLLQEETGYLPALREFADLSRRELDRIETLVQNLLQMAKLDTGTLITQKAIENVADMMGEIRQHFQYRARQEQKKLLFSGPDDIVLFCDRDWMMEAVSNLVKNALDHTQSGEQISVVWRKLSSLIQIVVEDNGSGIHPEDLYHIFKRFYRSRFSQDTQGIGLGLPLAKAIIEEHNGTIQVNSVLGQGSVFTLNFLIPATLQDYKIVS